MFLGQSNKPGGTDGLPASLALDTMPSVFTVHYWDKYTSPDSAQLNLPSSWSENIWVADGWNWL